VYGLGSWSEFQEAVAAFGLLSRYTRADVELSFRRLARDAHPDVGGNLEAFKNLIARRDLLLRSAADWLALEPCGGP